MGSLTYSTTNVRGCAVYRAEEPAHYVWIWIAGDAQEAKRICQAYCLRVGLCVTVTKTDFVYTGGFEEGVQVGLVNYPRFPTSPEQLWETAEILALELIEGLYQHSALVQSGSRAVWITKREQPKLT
jgi:hypothetical protein